jgi:hypothetical protein
MGSSDLTPAWLDRAQCVDSLRRATSRSRSMASPGSTVSVTAMARDVRTTGLPHQRERSNLCLTPCAALRVTGGGCSMVISRLHDLRWQVHGCDIPCDRPLELPKISPSSFHLADIPQYPERIDEFSGVDRMLLVRGEHHATSLSESNLRPSGPCCVDV